MRFVHFYHRHHLHNLSKHPDFSLFEAAIWLHTLALSLVSVFVPILLVQSGYTIGNVIFYYLIFNAIDVPLNFFVEKLIRKVGARIVLILGTLSVIAFFILLGNLPPNNWSLLLSLAFLAAMYDTFFWISHIYMFIEANRDHINTGDAVGSLESVRKFGYIVGPAIGAFILILAGKSLLIVTSIALFVLSIIPLFRMRHVRDLPKGKGIKISKFFSNLREKRNYLSIALWGVHTEAEDTLWPLYIFLTIGTLSAVAAVPTLVALTTAIFSIFAGKLTNKYTQKMIILGSGLIGFIWILRILFQNYFLFYATVFFVGFLSLLVSLPLDRSITSHGIKTDSLSASTYRNASAMLFRVFLYLMLLVLVEIFKVSFMMAAASLFLILAATTLLNPDISAKK